jgi:hypothetical protein
MGRRFWGGGAVVAATAAGFVFGQTSALAATYPSGAVGYDISYPQCHHDYPSGTFGIVGVNAGYPFTYYNQCFSSEWSTAQRTASPSLYINTGYDPTYIDTSDGRHSTLDCVLKAGATSGTIDQQLAWAVGCSEAQRSLAWASCGDNAVPPTCSTTVSPAAWWLDVETGNSWCGQPMSRCTDVSLNRYAIQGIVDTLHDPLANPASAPVGVYSTSRQWSSIVGGNRLHGIQANWVATGARSAKTAKSSCQRSGFTGAPVQLVQFASGSHDADYAC